MFKKETPKNIIPKTYCINFSKIRYISGEELRLKDRAWQQKCTSEFVGIKGLCM